MEKKGEDGVDFRYTSGRKIGIYLIFQNRHGDRSLKAGQLDRIPCEERGMEAGSQADSSFYEVLKGHLARAPARISTDRFDALHGL